MHKGLNITFWNMRSLFNKFESLTCEVTSLAHDFFDISESWLQNELMLLVYQIIAL